MGIWTLLLALILFWGVRFPFHYRTFRVLNRIRFVHFASVILALFLPLVFALINLRNGYSISPSSPHTCAGRTAVYNFYTIRLPLCIIVAVTACLMVVIFWTIIKEFVLKKILLKKKVINVRKAELKIAILACHFIIFAVLAIVKSVYAGQNDPIMENLVEYFLCESTGSLRDCNLDESVQATLILTTVSQVLLDFTPVVILMISYDFKCCKKKGQAKNFNAPYCQPQRRTL